LTKIPKKPLLPWIFIKDSALYVTPVLKVISREVISPKDGKNKSFCVLDTPQWVNVLSITPEKKIVLVNQYRHGSKTFSIELPGGVVEPENTLEEAARRELMEETGYSAKIFKLFYSVNPNPAIFGNSITTFLALDAQKTGETHFDENEETEVILLTFPELKEQFLIGTFNHALMAAAIGYFLSKYPEGL
jgi:8-oxo-dGTP pyrophosphatase MutT (NUDIX family)